MTKFTICAHFPCNYLSPAFERALRSLSWVDAIVLQDASEGEALATQAKVIRPDIIVVKDNNPELRERLMRWKDHTRHDYILWAMADEIWPENLGWEIRNVLNKDPAIEGISIPHTSYSFGQIEGTGWPQCRVIKRNNLQFKTSNIHEMPAPGGKVISLNVPYSHYPNQNMLLSWVKNYKYMVTEATENGPSSDHVYGWAHEKNLNYAQFIKYWTKANYHFLKAVWYGRKKGLSSLLSAHCVLNRHIINVFARAEAKAMLSRGEEYEMLGHVATMPKLRRNQMKD